MILEVFPDNEGNFDANQLNWIKQLINSFAHYKSYDITVGLKKYRDVTRLVLDGSTETVTNILEIEGTDATMVALYEECVNEIGGFQKIVFRKKN